MFNNTRTRSNRISIIGEGIEKPKHFHNDVDIIFEENTPAWGWGRTGIFGADGSTKNELKDGENVMIIYFRQSSTLLNMMIFSGQVIWNTNRQMKTMKTLRSQLYL